MQRSIVALVGAVLSLVSCNYIDAAKSDKPRGSCERTEKPLAAGSARTCSDAFTRQRLRICSGKTEKKSETPCVTDKAIAGCKHADGTETEWFYNDTDGYATVESVGKYCIDTIKGTTVMANGTTVAVKNEDARNEDDAKKNLAEHGAKARANLATIASAAARLPAPTGKVDLQGLKGDVLVIHREDLADPENPKKLDYRLSQGSRLGECSRALNNRRKKADPSYALSYCAKDAIFAIVSVTSYMPAASTGTSVSGKTKTTYVKKGTISGDLLFFRMDNGKSLGSFGFITESAGDSSPEQLNKDLIERFPTTLFTRARSVVPDLKMAFDLDK